MSRRFQASLRAAIVLAVGVSACGMLSSSALAETSSTPRPGWMLTAGSYPTALHPGGSGTIVVNVINDGAAASSGQITVTDTLPAGVTAEEAGEPGSFNPFGGQEEVSIANNDWECTGNGPGGVVAGASTVTCTNKEALSSIPGGGGSPATSVKSPCRVAVKVHLPAGETTETNHVTIAGGGALAPASTSDQLLVSSKELPFGFEGWRVWASNANGTLDTQAGSHPYEVTFAYKLNNYYNESFSFGWSPSGNGTERSPLQTKNIEVRLPPGFAGEPNAIPRCTRQQLDAAECPAGSQLGLLTVIALGGLQFVSPIYNMVPPTGYPDEIGYIYGSYGEQVETRFDTTVRSGSDYGLTTHVFNVPEKNITESVLTIWGVPGDPSHEAWRTKGGVSGESKPFFTLPTSCGAPPTFSIKANAWQDPGLTGEKSTQLEDNNGAPTGFTGCEHLAFGPTVSTEPDTAKADTPAGLTVEVKAPVDGLTNAEGLSGGDIENTTVALPRGVVINPGQAAGLQDCAPSEDGLEPFPNGEEDNGPPSCPNASKVGTDEIVTPLLTKPLQGNVYLLESNPPELKLLVAASAEGVNIKIVGVVHLNETTGQLVTTFEHTPELPFTNFRLSFSGGAQAALATPTKCGIYGPAQGFSADFTPWSTPFGGDAFPTAEFAITSGTDGAPCPPSPLPYTPQMIAGATTDQAGGYTTFSLLLQVPDDQQRTTRLQFKTPEGLLGMISRVPLCTNAQAEANACPAASEIGHTVVASGPGPYPLVIPEPGQPPAPIYLTEGYEGAPYGLSIVVPIHVGPFTLPTQRVRAKIEVDELTSQLTVTTKELPQVVAGVPTDLRSINAVIDKPGFMFNPTSCEPQAFSGTAYGTEGAQAPISSHFQMGSCRALLFKPNFKASTSGKTSRANGASLGVKIVYPTGELGANQASSQANIRSVKVELPKKLPSRLTTLQKACTAAQFDSNPAGCPAASVVGHAKAVTPVLPVALEGPAYFVSNGNEAFPNLIIVLQGYGVTIHLVGDTFISGRGITSSTFKQVPDVPIASFELNLPEGPYSALAANGSLCKSKLTMPTHFVAQNGAELQQKTPIAVTGCAKAKRATHKKKRHKRGGKRAKRARETQ
ncbi:MAG TPA: hypothetical protein VMU32_06995 [Solirubrobacteraceae bacterium]|nr:hypothetical protein [Solirubrobacteraceae bacterium]